MCHIDQYRVEKTLGIDHLYYSKKGNKNDFASGKTHKVIMS